MRSESIPTCKGGGGIVGGRTDSSEKIRSPHCASILQRWVPLGGSPQQPRAPEPHLPLDCSLHLPPAPARCFPNLPFALPLLFPVPIHQPFCCMPMLLTMPFPLPLAWPLPKPMPWPCPIAQSRPSLPALTARTEK